MKKTSRSSGLAHQLVWMKIPGGEEQRKILDANLWLPHTHAHQETYAKPTQKLKATQSDTEKYPIYSGFYTCTQRYVHLCIHGGTHGLIHKRPMGIQNNVQQHYYQGNVNQNHSDILNQITDARYSSP